MSNQTTFSLFSFISEHTDFWNLTASDYLNFVGSFGGAFFSALIAAGVAYYIHWLQSQKDNKKILMDEVHRHNESVSYYAAWFESTFPIIADLALNSYLDENLLSKRFIEKITSGGALRGGEVRFSFQSIRNIELPANDEFISKVLNTGTGTEIDITHTYHRLRNEIIQFNSINEERTLIIKSLVAKEEYNDFHRMHLRFGEVFDRTKKLLKSGELILNNAIYLSRLLEKHTVPIKAHLNRYSLKGIKINYLEENRNHIDEYEKIKSIIDQIGGSPTRFLNPI